jgi:hypothetical protein
MRTKQKTKIKTTPKLILIGIIFIMLGTIFMTVSTNNIYSSEGTLISPSESSTAEIDVQTNLVSANSVKVKMDLLVSSNMELINLSIFFKSSDQDGNWNSEEYEMVWYDDMFESADFNEQGYYEKLIHIHTYGTLELGISVKLIVTYFEDEIPLEEEIMLDSIDITELGEFGNSETLILLHGWEIWGSETAGHDAWAHYYLHNDFEAYYESIHTIELYAGSSDPDTPIGTLAYNLYHHMFSSAYETDPSKYMYGSVDIVSWSMGGLVARYLAKNYYLNPYVSWNWKNSLGNDVRINHIFCLGTPNLGHLSLVVDYQSQQMKYEDPVGRAFLDDLSYDDYPTNNIFDQTPFSTEYHSYSPDLIEWTAISGYYDATSDGLVTYDSAELKNARWRLFGDASHHIVHGNLPTDDDIRDWVKAIIFEEHHQPSLSIQNVIYDDYIATDTLSVSISSEYGIHNAVILYLSEASGGWQTFPTTWISGTSNYYAELPIGDLFYPPYNDLSNTYGLSIEVYSSESSGVNIEPYTDRDGSIHRLGNTRSSTIFTWDDDNTAPDVMVTYTGDGTVLDNDTTVIFTATDPSGIDGIDTVQFTLDSNLGNIWQEFTYTFWDADLDRTANPHPEDPTKFEDQSYNEFTWGIELYDDVIDPLTDLYYENDPIPEHIALDYDSGEVTVTITEDTPIIEILAEESFDDDDGIIDPIITPLTITPTYTTTEPPNPNPNQDNWYQAEFTIPVPNSLGEYTYTITATDHYDNSIVNSITIDILDDDITPPFMQVYPKDFQFSSNMYSYPISDAEANNYIRLQAYDNLDGDDAITTPNLAVDPNQAEPYTDSNTNGQWDQGEPYEDWNGNGQYDDEHLFYLYDNIGYWHLEDAYNTMSGFKSRYNPILYGEGYWNDDGDGIYEDGEWIWTTTFDPDELDEYEYEYDYTWTSVDRDDDRWELGENIDDLTTSLDTIIQFYDDDTTAPTIYSAYNEIIGEINTRSNHIQGDLPITVRVDKGVSIITFIYEGKDDEFGDPMIYTETLEPSIYDQSPFTFHIPEEYIDYNIIGEQRFTITAVDRDENRFWDVSEDYTSYGEAYSFNSWVESYEELGGRPNLYDEGIDTYTDSNGNGFYDYLDYHFYDLNNNGIKDEGEEWVDRQETIQDFVFILTDGRIDWIDVDILKGFDFDVQDGQILVEELSFSPYDFDSRGERGITDPIIITSLGELVQFQIWSIEHYDILTSPNTREANHKDQEFIFNNIFCQMAIVNDLNEIGETTIAIDVENGFYDDAKGKLEALTSTPKIEALISWLEILITNLPNVPSFLEPLPADIEAEGWGNVGEVTWIIKDDQLDANYYNIMIEIEIEGLYFYYPLLEAQWFVDEFGEGEITIDFSSGGSMFPYGEYIFQIWAFDDEMNMVIDEVIITVLEDITPPLIEVIPPFPTEIPIGIDRTGVIRLSDYESGLGYMEMVLYSGSTEVDRLQTVLFGEAGVYQMFFLPYETTMIPNVVGASISAELKVGDRDYVGEDMIITVITQFLIDPIEDDVVSDMINNNFYIPELISIIPIVEDQHDYASAITELELLLVIYTDPFEVDIIEEIIEQLEILIGLEQTIAEMKQGSETETQFYEDAKSTLQSISSSMIQSYQDIIDDVIVNKINELIELIDNNLLDDNHLKHLSSLSITSTRVEADTTAPEITFDPPLPFLLFIEENWNSMMTLSDLGTGISYYSITFDSSEITSNIDYYPYIMNQIGIDIDSLINIPDVLGTYTLEVLACDELYITEDMITYLLDLYYTNYYQDLDEPYIDENGNEEYDFGEPFTDLNGNGVWDEAEWYWDEAEWLEDFNGNEVWDDANGIYDEGLDTFYPYHPDYDINMDGDYDEGIDYYIDNPEYFSDTNGNGVWDDANGMYDFPEPYADLDGDGWYDNEEPYSDSPDGVYQPEVDHWIALDPYYDPNLNGIYEIGEPFDDQGNGQWNEAEPYVDTPDGFYQPDVDYFIPYPELGWEAYDLNENGVFDLGIDNFDDYGNGQWDQGEEYTDTNGNGQYDAEESYDDFNGNGQWDDHEPYDDVDEPYVDLNGNLNWDSGEPFTDLNGNGFHDDGTGNGKYDYGESFSDNNWNGYWDDEEPYDDDDLNGEYTEGEPFEDLDNDNIWDQDLVQQAVDYWASADYGNAFNTMLSITQILIQNPEASEEIILMADIYLKVYRLGTLMQDSNPSALQENNDAHSTIFTHIFERIGDTIPPTVNSPIDLTYEWGSIDNEITWIAEDNYQLASYSITRDAIEVQSGTLSGTYAELTIDIDGLDIGTYSFIITVSDGYNQISDEVIVNVEDNSIPTVDSPLDITYEDSSSGNSIIWNMDDNYGTPSYSITQNAIEIDSGISNQIIIDIDGLDLGTYTFEITVSDISGNSITDSVNVEVIDDDTEAPIITFEYTGNYFDNVDGEVIFSVYDASGYTIVSYIEQIFTIEVIDNDNSPMSSTLSVSITIADDDTEAPIITFEYTGNYFDNVDGEVIFSVYDASGYTIVSMMQVVIQSLAVN